MTPGALTSVSCSATPGVVLGGPESAVKAPGLLKVMHEVRFVHAGTLALSLTSS